MSGPKLRTTGHGGMLRRTALLGGAAGAVATNWSTAFAAAAPVVRAVAAENEYADVIAQIGGADVQATAIETDPNTDPHTFEISPSVAQQIAGADLVVKNGLGYDGWVDKIIAAAPRPGRKVIDVQQLLHLPDTTPNPHLWYDPRTMPAVAAAVATALAALDRPQAAQFHAAASRFTASLKPWTDAIAAFKARHRGVAIAATEPVANYMLEAAGCAIATPFSLQAALMNGTDPAPQDVTTQNTLLGQRKVAAFVYNQQVTDALTKSFLDLARKSGVPVVGVYETMPTGYHYQSWMLAEVTALTKAVENKISTERL
jgi:zinc/manganese transport system substrate-binding protein